MGGVVVGSSRRRPFATPHLDFLSQNEMASLRVAVLAIAGAPCAKHPLQVPRAKNSHRGDPRALHGRRPWPSPHDRLPAGKVGQLTLCYVSGSDAISLIWPLV